MTFTYDPSTPAGEVRLYIPDRDEDAAMFDDVEIDVFLAQNGGDTLLAAASALETVASSNAMVLKVMTVLGTTTDGAKVSDSLLRRAAVLRQTAAKRDEAAGADEYVGVARAVVDQFSWKEIAGR